MANVLKSNTYIIDTASADALVTVALYVSGLRYVAEGATAGDNVIVQDQQGNAVWECVVTAANFQDETMFADRGGRLLDGLKVPTLQGGGKLYIYRQ